VTMKEEDNIEKFFRKRLSEKEFEFDESQWARLEKKLDDEYPAPVVVPQVNNSAGSKMKWILLLLLTALISFWSGWYLKTNTDQTISNGEDSVKQSPFNDNKTASKEKQGETNAKESIESRHENGRNLTEPGSGITTDDDKQLRQSKINMGVMTVDEPMQETDRNEVPTVSSFQSVGGQVSIYKDSLKERMNSEEGKVLVDSLTNTPKEKADSIVSDSNPFYRTSRVDYFAFAAPDFSGTNNSNILEGAGVAFGIGAAYYITDRIRVGAGLTLNNKVYTAAKGEYKPQYGFWTNHTAPMETDAKCLMLDIPVNVAYRIINVSRNSFWINAGVSSYWFLTEKYKYIYSNPDPALVQEWYGERENSDFMSSVNLSLFYEHELKKQFAFFIEPYYKVPVGKGIGQGSVELWSSGVNFGIRFRPTRNISDQ
jgi:hypothetical protein